MSTCVRSSLDGVERTSHVLALLLPQNRCSESLHWLGRWVISFLQGKEFKRVYSGQVHQCFGRDICTNPQRDHSFHQQISVSFLTLSEISVRDKKGLEKYVRQDLSRTQGNNMEIFPFDYLSYSFAHLCLFSIHSPQDHNSCQAVFTIRGLQHQLGQRSLSCVV